MRNLCLLGLVCHLGRSASRIVQVETGAQSEALAPHPLVHGAPGVPVRRPFALPEALRGPAGASLSALGRGPEQAVPAAGVENAAPAQSQRVGTLDVTATTPPAEQTQTDRRSGHAGRSIVIIGGGVSGIWAALTLKELGYSNITLLERELQLGGKAAAFEHERKKYPLGAVGTSLALESASFTEEQLFEKPRRFARSLLGPTGRRLRVLDANHLMARGTTWPRRFPKDELTSQTPVLDWQRAFGAKGRPERFYPHRIDFRSGHAELAQSVGNARIVPRWGRPETSWPLVYVSAHGYGVAEAGDAPPYYYWARFAQKSTNAGARGPLGMALPGHDPLGPRGPALRGWDSTRLFEEKLRAAGVRVRRGATVASVARGPDRVTVRTRDGWAGNFDYLVLAADLKGALAYLDADPVERGLFSKIVHQPYYTVASFIALPWLAALKVYYLSDFQSGAGADAGRATRGCPTILMRPQKRSNLTISWAYGGAGVGPAEIEACLRRTVAELGGKFGGVKLLKEWPDYFPHVRAADLEQNFHQQLDKLQGKRRMFMVGEIFNLPLVSECVDWARYLMRRHFAGGRVSMIDTRPQAQR